MIENCFIKVGLILIKKMFRERSCFRSNRNCQRSNVFMTRSLSFILQEFDKYFEKVFAHTFRDSQRSKVKVREKQMYTLLPVTPKQIKCQILFSVERSIIVKLLIH